MRGRTGLEVILGAVFGAIIGGILTISLLFSGTAHWLIYSPMIVGAVAGLWKGDRALLRIMKLVSLYPG